MVTYPVFLYEFLNKKNNDLSCMSYALCRFMAWLMNCNAQSRIYHQWLGTWLCINISAFKCIWNDHLWTNWADDKSSLTHTLSRIWDVCRGFLVAICLCHQNHIEDSALKISIWFYCNAFIFNLCSSSRGTNHYLASELLFLAVRLTMISAFQ